MEHVRAPRLLDDLPGHVAERRGRIVGVEALLLRTDELSLPSVRGYVAWDLAEYVWERLMEAGHPGGITPVGLDPLRLLGAR